MVETLSVKLPALGRPFSLGSLYDCRSDQLISGITLWNFQALKNDVATEPKKFSMVKAYGGDDFQTKANAFEVEGNLKASVLCGLVGLEGSAEVLKNRKSSSMQARVILRYSLTTRYDHLTMSHLGIENVQHPNVFEDGLATHVVVGIVYGVDAIFIFDQNSSDEKAMKKIEVELEASLNKVTNIGKCVADGSGKFELEVDKLQAGRGEKFSCTFCGDFGLKKLPTTFADAIRLYENIPSDIGPNEENVVPKTVWLYPLHLLNTEASRIVSDIRSSLVSSIQDIMENLHETIAKGNYLRKKEAMDILPGELNRIVRFIAVVEDYKAQLQQKILPILSKVKGGEEEETAIIEVLNQHKSCLFGGDKLKCWLESRRREIDQINNLMIGMKTCSSIETRDQVEDMINSLKYDHILCFIFQLDSSEDLFIDQLKGHMQNEEHAPETEIKTSSWSDHNQTQTYVRLMAIHFLKFAELNGSGNETRLKFCISSGPLKTLPVDIVLFDMVSMVSFIPPSKPMIPTFVSSTENSITITNIDPDLGSENVTAYEVLYRKEQSTGGEWSKQVIPRSSSGRYQIEGLESVKNYEFKVKAICKVGHSEESSISLSMKTAMEPAELVLPIYVKNMSLLDAPGTPRIYKLPIKVTFYDSLKKIKFCDIGCEVPLPFPEKVVILLGGTGSGKTTIINGLANYIYGVQWRNDFRFKVITEKDEGGGSQAYSKTTNITSYTFHHMEGSPVPYTMNLIDTPGFGDTSGIKTDEATIRQLKTFFNHKGSKFIDHLDAIIFVFKAPDGRLNDAQLYIVNSLLSIFGKDIVDNILVFVTFADRGEPIVLAGLREEEVPFKQYFKFNNCMLYSNNEQLPNEESSDEKVWKECYCSFEAFFTELSKLPRKSLELTKEVLDERQTLEVAVQGLQRNIRAGLNKLEQLKKEEDIIKEHEPEIEADKVFEYQVVVTFHQKIDLNGKFATNCTECNCTCHHPCTIPRDISKWRCHAMWFGRCTACPGRCSWKVHVNNTYRLEMCQGKMMKTSKNLEENFFVPNEGKTKTQTMLDNLTAELEDIQEQVCKDIICAKNCVNKLNKIALKANPLTVADYIEFLIKCEEKRGRDGWQQRIEYLFQAKEKAEILEKIISDPAYDVLEKNFNEIQDDEPLNEEATGGEGNAKSKKKKKKKKKLKRGLFESFSSSGNNIQPETSMAYSCYY